MVAHESRSYTRGNRDLFLEVSKPFFGFSQHLGLPVHTKANDGTRLAALHSLEGSKCRTLGAGTSRSQGSQSSREKRTRFRQHFLSIFDCGQQPGGTLPVPAGSGNCQSCRVVSCGAFGRHPTAFYAGPIWLADWQRHGLQSSGWPALSPYQRKRIS
jgi:hypothetical protein